MCVLPNERYKTNQTGFSFCCQGHAPGVGLWGAGGQKLLFFKNGHVAYQIEKADEQKRMQVKFSSWGQTGDPGVSQKVKYHKILTTLPILRVLYQTLCAFSQIKDRKHIEQNFHSVAGSCPRGGTWGCWVGQKL